MTIDFDLAMALTSLVISIVGILGVYLRGYIAILERLKALEVKVDVFWTSIQNEVIRVLKHPTAIRKDELLDKFVDQQLEVPDIFELLRLLEDDVKKKSGTTESLAAVLVIARLKQMLVGLKCTGDFSGKK